MFLFCNGSQLMCFLFIFCCCVLCSHAHRYSLQTMRSIKAVIAKTCVNVEYKCECQSRPLRGLHV